MTSAFARFAAVVLLAAAPSALPAAPATVFLEDLTWTELRDDIRAGKTTIIVPIGGTEQNGPHMALGKHNARVKALSEKIARELGNALVAPVIAYVPEGSVEPPSAHMRFPGTITVPDAAFEKVLEGAARSFKLHGFRDIVFIGDHGGYQKDLQAAAARLNREWAATPVRAHAVVEYYRATTTAYVDALTEARLHRRRNRHARGRRRYVADAGADPGFGARRSPGQCRQAYRQRRRVRRSSPGQRRSGTIGGGCHRRRDRGRDPAGHRAPLTHFHRIQFRRFPQYPTPFRNVREAIQCCPCARGRAPARAVAAIAFSPLPAFGQAAAPTAPAVTTVPGMPPVPDPSNLYSETTAAKISPAVAGDLQRVYVPHIQSNDVYVIDPATFQVVDKFKVGLNPQHVVPSWDLRTLWVANNAENTKKGSLTPVDPKTGKPGKPIAVDDPYNMYFSPDGKSAIVVAEAMKRLDFRDPKTMQLQYSIDVPRCAGINHADFSIDGRYVIFTCEFTGTVAKIDLVERKVLGYIQVIQPGRPTKTVKGPDGRDEVICTTWKGMPQDIRASPDGKLYFVADMMADGVHVVDGDDVQAGRLHRNRQGHARPLPQPRRQVALRRQPRLQQDPRPGRRARAAFR